MVSLSRRRVGHARGLHQGVAHVFHGWRVVAACFVIAAVAWALGLFGSSVYLQAVTAAHGWPIAEVASAITLFFLVSALVQRTVGRSHRPLGAAAGAVCSARCRCRLGVALHRPGLGALAALSLLRADRPRLVDALDHRHRRDRGAVVRAPSGPLDGARHHGRQRRRHRSASRCCCSRSGSSASARGLVVVGAGRRGCCCCR